MVTSGKGRFSHLAGSLVLLVISSLVAFGLAEYGFRIIKEWKWRGEATGWTNELFEPLLDSPLEYRLYPGVARENLIPDTGLTWKYQINSDGFRGEDLYREKDSRRVLFLGDSYTFGWAVEQDQVLSESAQRVLAAPPYNMEIQAYNLGVPGYNTFQEYHLLNQVVDRYAPDMVVLGYVLNDAEPQQSVPQRPSVRYKYVTSWMFAYLKEQINYYIFDGKPVLNTGVVDVLADYRTPIQENGPAWAESRQAFADLAALCQERDIPFVVLIYPDYTQEFDDTYLYQTIHQEVVEWADKSGVRTVDLLNYVKGKDAKNYRVEGDGHPNGRTFAEAAQLLAPLIYESLEGSSPP
jgi:lysophospholipase L1-like esterase